MFELKSDRSEYLGWSLLAGLSFSSISAAAIMEISADKKTFLLTMLPKSISESYMYSFFTLFILISIVFSLFSILGFELFTYFMEEYFPKRSALKRLRENRNELMTKFKVAENDINQYQMLIKLLVLLDEINYDADFSSSRVFQSRKVIPYRTNLKRVITRIETYLSEEVDQKFSLGRYPEVFRRITGAFYVFLPSIEEFVREYKHLLELKLNYQHQDKIGEFLEGIFDCLKNFEQRILTEFEEVKKNNDGIVHDLVDLSIRNIKFEKQYLTGHEQFPEFIDQYEEGDPRIRELTMKTNPSSESTKSSKKKSIDDDLQHSLLQHSVFQQSILNKEESESSSSYNNSSNYDHSSNNDCGTSDGGYDL
ncbi:hypothetical protein H9S87_18780 (plasmid) [Bacillus pumilus]|uniref:hypothetical protein n=1 Tax=Bacillus pumilus TaxID=1408 RepID=UPI0016586487|nr:hypothetical protein [Bacillus pumilus]QNP18330.1 hypothetical protein H9S87_18780 [Bacillus pumilus]